ncbi:MAG: NADH-quinone oxidoreductase subunit A [Deltaproteobacteria bacterium]|nr:NADH-quinone oxidoreductase subunit A [Deltaproteobacteria bacterium]
MSVVNSYEGVLILMLVAAGFLVTMLTLASLFGPKNRTHTKQLPFECGSVSVGNVSDQRFNVRFYLVAMLFILFDIEVIFMYPWAVEFDSLGMFGFVEMLLFMSILAVGLVYVWRKGILNWND